MPDNGKVVVVDAQLPLSQVFRIFVEQWTTCAVVWMEDSGCTMLLNTTHLIKVLLQYSKEVEPAMLAERLAQVTIAQWLGDSKLEEMPSVAPEVSLHDAIHTMEQHGYHRLPVVEK